MRVPKKMIRRARRLRRNLSKPEAALWRRLRGRMPSKPVFRRQHPIGPYVLDFYCASARRAVELDGIVHDMADRPQRDIKRDEWLQSRGVTVIRLSARELMGNLDDIADAIVRMAAETH